VSYYRIFSPKHRILLPLVLACCLTLALGGCGGRSLNPDDPADVFQDAQDDIQSDRFLMALDKLRKIRHKFPYSKFAAKAQLRIADVYFLQDSYAEAATAYEAFRELYPRNEEAPYALYRVGESHFRGAPKEVARDLDTARSALSAFQKFLRRYPKDKRADSALKQVRSIRGILARKELYIADFYRIRDHFLSALPRYEKVVKLYPETESAKKAKAQIEAIQKKAQAQLEAERDKEKKALE